MTDPRARVVAGCSDDAVASSTVLAEAGLSASAPVILRHRLRVPADRCDEVIVLLEREDYRVTVAATGDPGAGERGSGIPGPGDVTLTAGCGLRADAVAVSRERTRLASLASRHGGTVLDWELAVIDDPGR